MSKIKVSKQARKEAALELAQLTYGLFKEERAKVKEGDESKLAPVTEATKNA